MVNGVIAGEESSLLLDQISQREEIVENDIVLTNKGDQECQDCCQVLIIDDNNFNIFSLQCLLEMSYQIKSEFVSFISNTNILGLPWTGGI